MDRWFRGGPGCAHAPVMVPAVVILIFVNIFVVVAAAGPPAAGAADHGQSGSWSLPVPGAVERGFDAAATRYGPGHRGVDFAAPAGAPVRAAGDGVVSFAGPVAGALHIVVAHTGDLRTSYSFLATAVVRRGATVARGDLIGTTGGPAGPHPPGLHFGLRRGDEYLDPMLLFRPTDLSEVVHLAPARGGGPTVGSWAVEALGVRRGIEIDDRVLTRATVDDRDAGSGNDRRGLAGTIGGWLGGAVAVGADFARGLPGAGDAETVAARLVAAARTRLDCTASPPEADGSGGSGHLLMAVGGINSSTDRETGATFGLPPDALGYLPDEITWYSYAAGGGAYVSADTHGRIELAAARLADQLRDLHDREPGREVDLVAHSQGGVVVDEFLQHVYDASDPTFPPIGIVVTLSSPHQGAPLATAADRIAATAAGRDALAGVVDLGLPARTAALDDLREDSRTMRQLWRHRLPEHVDFTTIGAVDDVVVPASQTALPGATEVVVNPPGRADHTTVTSDDEALAAVRLALEGRPPLCPDAVSAVRGALEPVLITRLERAAGHVGRAAGEAVDAAGEALDTAGQAVDGIVP